MNDKYKFNEFLGKMFMLTHTLLYIYTWIYIHIYIYYIKMQHIIKRVINQYKRWQLHQMLKQRSLYKRKTKTNHIHIHI